MRRDDIRNVVIIAHVDHGKTTLVDCLLQQSGQFRESQLQERVLDSNDLERERGITILSKNIAIPYQGVKINIIDTPGHSDFGGEVERVVRMADGAVLLVDAAEGPMPQTRFVLAKALEAGLKPLVVVNKIDRPDARTVEVLDEAFELVMDLAGEDAMSDFPYIFASSKEGYAVTDPDAPGESMRPLLDMILEHVPGPDVDAEAPLQMLVTTLDWSEYVGKIAVGRIQSGRILSGQTALLSKADDRFERVKVAELHVFENLGRQKVEEATAGDIVALVGLSSVEIGDTVCDADNPDPLPRLTIDEPTLEMMFTINSSPLAGRDGKFVTTRQLRERLYAELDRNVALRVEPGANADSFVVRGRGVLHLAVLIETMRREGYELSVGKPQVVNQLLDGQVHEPFETLVVEAPEEKLGPVMELVGARRGQLKEMLPRGGYSQCVFEIPARGLIGLRTRLLNATQGEAIIHHRFLGYRQQEGAVPTRVNGVLVSMVSGRAVGYAMDGLQSRGEMFVKPGDDVYEGMVVGEHCKDNDLIVNPIKEKKLTNIRAAGNDANILLKPPRQFSLEAALEYIEDDELVEITPSVIRMRKALLQENQRKRAGRR